MSLLLDTCAAIWAANDELEQDAIDALNATQDQGAAVHVSVITAWEIGMLMSRGRIASPLSPLDWFLRFTATRGVKVSELTPEVLVNASFLPGNPPRDPADQMIISTARSLGIPVMTRDKQILSYADAGHVTAIAC